jgi:hypothetical protein
MSQTYQSRTPNQSDRKTGTVIPMPRALTLTGAQAKALWEIATLVTYTDGFTYTPEMERVCELIADQGGSASDRAFYLARNDQREHAVIAPRKQRAA